MSRHLKKYIVGGEEGSQTSLYESEQMVPNWAKG